MSKLSNKEAVQKYYKKNSKKLNKQMVAQRAFSRMILQLDPQCMCAGCENASSSAHHIKYKSQWGVSDTERLGFVRDSNQNGIGLCAVHHHQVHNGKGIGQISGREFMYEILDGFDKNTGYYYRFLKIKEDLKKSLIRKGVIV